MFHRVRVVFLLLFVCGSLRDALSFYLPGLAPVNFCEKEESDKNSDVPDCKVNVLIHAHNKRFHSNVQDVSCFSVMGLMLRDASSECYCWVSVVETPIP